MHTQGYSSWNCSKSFSYSPSHIITPTVAAASAMACEDCIPTTHVTSQCTDQCVVITCDDPHELNECHGIGNLHCDLVCDGGPDCTDCDGLDETLQCCTDGMPNPSFPWDPPIEEFLCSCSDLQHAQNLSLHSTLPSTPLGTPSHTSPIDPPVGLPTQPPAQSSPLFTCLWGHCEAKFASLTELVGHVNLEHLRPPVHQKQEITSMDPTSVTANMACQWNDCTAYPPYSIPTSSTGDQASEILHFLTSHLLNDHLGVIDHNRTPVSTTASPSRVSFEKLVEADSPAIPSADNIKCHWGSCGRTFDSNELLTQHLNSEHIGSGKAYYECHWDGCNRSGKNGFSSKQKICRHLQTHTGHRPFQCDVCSQYFSEAATLQQHIRRHTQEKPYVCDHPGCGKTFAITGALTIHKRIHNGQKPFKCKFCDKGFSESSNLSKHLRTHTGARPYCCTEPGCNKSFARPDQLTRHSGVHRKKFPDQTDAS